MISKVYMLSFRHYLSNVLKNSRKIEDDRLRFVTALGTLDPVDTMRFLGINNRVPSNVQYAANIYQKNGCYNGCDGPGSWFEGEYLSGDTLFINKNVSGEGVSIYGNQQNPPLIQDIPYKKAPDHWLLGYADWGPDGKAPSPNSYAKLIADLLLD